jgi:hypothetical protein
MKNLVLLVCAFCLLASCRQVDEITGNRPIVDTKGINPQVYEVDLQDCYMFADEVQAERKILAGAATGAVVKRLNEVLVWGLLAAHSVEQAMPCRNGSE